MDAALNLEIEVDSKIDILIQEYKKLDEKCDSVIKKIKTRKHNNPKKK
jgi:hypothetical protein